MGQASRKREELTHRHAVGDARDRDLRFPVDPKHERIVRRSVLAEPFASVECDAVTVPAGFLISVRLTTEPG